MTHGLSIDAVIANSVTQKKSLKIVNYLMWLKIYWQVIISYKSLIGVNYLYELNCDGA